MNEKHYLNKCLKLIREKLVWGEISEWTNHNYNLLSNYIHDISGVIISPRTIRRIFNNTQLYTPQTATKNALANYLGFKDWEDFKINVNKKSPENPNYVEKQHIKKRNITPWFILGLSIPIIIILTILLYPAIQLELNKRRVEFRSNEITGTAPHSASFYYDVTRLKATNFYINRNFYGDDKGKLVPIEKYRHLYNTSFDLPDYYAVKIVAGGERVSCVGVHVITRGWDYIVNNQYFSESSAKIIKNGLLNLPFSKNNLAADSMSYRLEYRNIRNFNVIADNMEFSARVRTISVEDNPCGITRIDLINVHGRISLTFAEPGCNRGELNVEVGEIIMNGNYHDLNPFYQDFSYFRNLHILVKNKTVSIYLDNNELMKVRYQDQLDELKGIAFRFAGDGAVDHVKILDGRGNEVYTENFE